MIRLPALLFLAISPFLFAQSRVEQTADPIRVLVLGTYHFDNPGHDLHNMKVDDVRTPAKQAELADVATRLARFNPNKIAVEALPDGPNLTTKKFDGFSPDMLSKDADERVQIAFRLAQKLGHKSVYGIDEQSDQVDYFPYDKVQSFAKDHGNSALLEQLNARVAEMMRQMQVAQKTTPVRQMLARLNEPKQVEADHCDFYYPLLPVGDSTMQPGADLNGGWYLRNAKIFAKLTQIAKPGDRIVVVFGSGHLYWLRHFTRSTPGFELAEPNQYLK